MDIQTCDEKECATFALEKTNKQVLLKACVGRSLAVSIVFLSPKYKVLGFTAYALLPVPFCSDDSSYFCVVNIKDIKGLHRQRPAWRISVKVCEWVCACCCIEKHST